jgi:hypothetical protein
MTNRHCGSMISCWARGLVVLLLALSFTVALGNLDGSTVEAYDYYVKCSGDFGCDNVTMHASCECDGYEGACTFVCTGSLYIPDCWYEPGSNPDQCDRWVRLFAYTSCGAATDPDCCGEGNDPCELDPSPPADIFILCSSYCILCP